MFLWTFLHLLRLWFHQRSFTSRGRCLYLSNSLWWVSEVLHRTQSCSCARIYSSSFVPTPTPLTAVGSWCRALKQRQNQFTNVHAPMGGLPFQDHPPFCGQEPSCVLPELWEYRSGLHLTFLYLFVFFVTLPLNSRRWYRWLLQIMCFLEKARGANTFRA